MVTSRYKDADGRVCYILLAKRIYKYLYVIRDGKDISQRMSKADVAAFKEFVRNGVYAYGNDGMLGFRSRNPEYGADDPRTFQVQAAYISYAVPSVSHVEYWEKAREALLSGNEEKERLIAQFVQACFTFWNRHSTLHSHDALLEFIEEQLGLYNFITKGV